MLWWVADGSLSEYLYARAVLYRGGGKFLSVFENRIAGPIINDRAKVIQEAAITPSGRRNLEGIANTLQSDSQMIVAQGA